MGTDPSLFNQVALTNLVPNLSYSELNNIIYDDQYDEITKEYIIDLFVYYEEDKYGQYSNDLKKLLRTIFKDSSLNENLRFFVGCRIKDYGNEDISDLKNLFEYDDSELVQDISLRNLAYLDEEYTFNKTDEILSTFNTNSQSMNIIALTNLERMARNGNIKGQKKFIQLVTDYLNQPETYTASTTDVYKSTYLVGLSEMGISEATEISDNYYENLPQTKAVSEAGLAAYRDGVIPLTDIWHTAIVVTSTGTTTPNVVHHRGQDYSKIRIDSWDTFLSGKNFEGIYRHPDLPIGSAVYSRISDKAQSMVGQNVSYAYVRILHASNEVEAIESNLIL